MSREVRPPKRLATRPRLRYLGGTYAGREVEVHHRLRLGRSRENDLVLPEGEAPTASARHAEVVAEGDRLRLADLGSTNGTFVNGVRVERADLRAGDRIGLGGGEALLEVVGEGAALGPRVVRPVVIAVLVLASVLLALSRRRPTTFEPAAAAAGRALYLVVVEKEGDRVAVGTAFAVAADGLLATNAHVARALELSGAVPVVGQTEAIAVRNDSSGVGRRILGARVHPRFRPGSFRDDVALLRLEPGEPLAALPLASAAELAAVRRGTPLASFGFPAAATDPRRPRARLREHVVGDDRDGRYLELGSGIAPGSSGSPLLDLGGRVVGVVVGGDFRPGPGAAGSSWAITAAAVSELLAAERAANP